MITTKIQLGLSLEKRVLFKGYLVFVLALCADGDWPLAGVLRQRRSLLGPVAERSWQTPEGT